LMEPTEGERVKSCCEDVDAKVTVIERMHVSTSACY
jgi:hypothetical protein